MARVLIENLTKTFPQPGGGSVEAVASLSLTVEDGELLVVVGPSGCGKTTALRLIAGLEDTTRGNITMDGRSLNGVAPKDRDVAMVFQHHALYPHMTARQNLSFGLKLRKCPPAEIAQRVDEAAKLLDLTACLDRLPAALSGGQRQRVALGRAMVRRPKVFLFDEPLSNLDAPMRLQMRREIARLHERLRATMLYVTHDQVEALTLGDRVAVMRSGRLVQVARPQELYERPANLFVAGFIGSPAMNFLTGALAQNGAGLVFAVEGEQGIELRVPAAMTARLSAFAGKKIVCGLRPEHLIAGNPISASPDTPLISARAEMVEPAGADLHIYAARGAQSLVARISPGARVTAHQEVSLAADMQHAHFFDPTTENAIPG